MRKIISESYELVPVHDLVPHERNPRQGDLGAIIESVQTNGFYGAVVAQKSTGKILVGNHRWRAAIDAGLTEIPCIWVDVDDDRATRILLADNATSDKATNEQTQLANLLKELSETPEGLSGTGFDGDDLDQLLADLEMQNVGAAEGEDDAPPVAETSVTRLGDLWILGQHRVLCGDSTSIDAVERLMDGEKADMVFTDPPYGCSAVKVKSGENTGAARGAKPFGAVGRGGSSGHMYPFGGVKGSAHGPAKNAIIKPKLYAPIIGDDTTETALDAYNLCASLEIPVQIFWGGNYYANGLPPSRCWIVWDKENTGTFADAELAWTNSDSPVRIFKHMWNGLMKASERGESRVHPTQKPIALAEWCFNEYGKKCKAVLDLFLGSGSTLIACEKTHRSCYGMELSEAYCDVIVNRWQTFTGKQAHLEDGRTFEELAKDRLAAKAVA